MAKTLNVMLLTIYQCVPANLDILEMLSFHALNCQVLFHKLHITPIHFYNFSVEEKQHPCNPSPCGPNSQCREINGQAVCSCVPGFIGSPPTCRPECITSQECPLNQACVNQKCIDPCPGTCGINAKCQVVNHNPFCTCLPQHFGDPFVRCLPKRKWVTILLKPQINNKVISEEESAVIPTNPCQPSPCGPHSQCKAIGESPSCSCLPEFSGTPPYCRPECISNSECPNHLACINQKCKDPCPGICGTNAKCRVISHTPNCLCIEGYIGDPFNQCILKPCKFHFRTVCTFKDGLNNYFFPADTLPDIVSPCSPSPCGVNAECKERNRAGSCQCLPDYIGNPYEGCRPECVLNSDCPYNKACIRSKCMDPCPGTCGPNAQCQVVNHLPLCTCSSGYTGDPFRFCTLLPSQRKHFHYFFRYYITEKKF